MGVVFYKDKKTLFLNLKISWKIHGQYHPTPFHQNTPIGKGGYTGGGIGGTPHIWGYVYISIWYPPLCYLINQYVIYESIIIQIYELYFTMSNYMGIKKGITFVEPTNESRTVIPFYFRKKYVSFRLGTGSSHY